MIKGIRVWKIMLEERILRISGEQADSSLLWNLFSSAFTNYLINRGYVHA